MSRQKRQPTGGVPPAAVAIAIVLMAGFIVWLCVQMAIDPFKGTFLVTIAGGIAVGVVALALGTLRLPSRRRGEQPRRTETAPEPPRAARQPGGMSPRPG